MKPRVLWIGDAVVQTGFARVTHNVLATLATTCDVAVMGINASGDPSAYPYPIYPAHLGGDVYGLGRLADRSPAGLLATVKPDVIVINNDPWIVALMLEKIPETVPVVAYMPVDGANQSAGPALNRLAMAVLYTEFGRKELICSGYRGRTAVIPHGVDTTLYRPIPRAEARTRLQLAEKLAPTAFIVGCVNRNQPRKRLDLTLQYWAQWWIDEGQPLDAYLYCHCANEDLGWNLLQLAAYYGINKQFIITHPKMTVQVFLDERQLPLVYNTFDVQLSTTAGEGWGLTQHEGMACGIPQIVPDYAALGEWCRGAVRYVPITAHTATVGGVNTIGGVPDRQETVAALHELYTDPAARAKLGMAGLARATLPIYRWPAIGLAFTELITGLVEEQRGRPVGLMPAAERGPRPMKRVG